MVAKAAKLSMALQGVFRLKIADNKGIRPLYNYRVSEIPTTKPSARQHPYDQSYVGALTDYSSGVEATDVFTGATESPCYHRFHGKILQAIFDIRSLKEQGKLSASAEVLTSCRAGSVVTSRLEIS